MDGGQAMRDEPAMGDIGEGGTGDDAPAAAAKVRQAAPARRTRGFARAAARLDRVSLAAPMAAVLGLSLAFALLAMPHRWLGLPGSPRLATALRLLVAIAGGGVGAGAVWMLFHRLERPMRAPVLMAADPEAPRLRRWDAHPDAPARRPICAVADLGAPLDEAAWEPSATWAASGSSSVAVPAEPGPVPSHPSAPAEPVPVPSRSVAPAAMPAPDPDPEPLLLDTPADPDPEPANVATETRVACLAERDAGRQSTAMLMARLEAALAAQARPTPRPAGETLRAAAAELRKIGNSI